MGRRTADRRADEAGFTLIETMIALALLAFIIGQLAMTSIYASNNNNHAQRMMKANNVAQLNLERCLNTAYANIALAQSYQETAPKLGGGVQTENIAETCAPDGGNANITRCVATSELFKYTRRRSITPLDNAYNVTSLASSNKADIDLAVEWVDGKGNTQTVKISTVMTRF